MALLIKYSRIAAYTAPKIHERVLTRVCVRFSVKIALIIHRLIIRLHRSYMRARSSNDSTNVINFHRGATVSSNRESRIPNRRYTHVRRIVNDESLRNLTLLYVLNVDRNMWILNNRWRLVFQVKFYRISIKCYYRLC